jgi:hypothetical protein
MDSSWVVVVVIIGAGVGLLTGRGLWALYLTHRSHRPDCPYRHEVLRDARRVQIDIEQLTKGGTA